MRLFFVISMVVMVAVDVWSMERADSLQNAISAQEKAISDIKVHASAFYSLGSYSTTTVSKNFSAFATVQQNKKTFYTLGYQTLAFSRDDMGQNYFLEYTFFGKGTHWVNEALNVSLVGAYDRQNEIQYYTPGFTFYVFGVNGFYWLSPTTAVGAAYSGGWQTSESQQYSFFGNSSAKQTAYAMNSGTLTLVHTIGEGIWFTTSAMVTDSKWAGTYCFMREQVTVRFGKHTNMKASFGLGRRTFYLDDELLLLYDQPEVQKGGFSLGGSIGLSNSVSLLPSFEYNQFDDYTVTYASLGTKVIF